MSELPVRPQTEIEKSCQATLLDVIAKNKRTIDAVLGHILDPKRFAYLAVMAIRQTPALAGCTPSSFLNAVMLASQMGLEIRRDSAYLIPFGKEVQLLIDYKGKMGLARRSGKVGGIQAITVREADEFDWHYDRSGVVFLHRPKLMTEEERGPIIGVYAFAQLTDGGTQFREPMSLAEVNKIRMRSRAGVAHMSIEQILEAGQIGEDGRQIWQSWDFRDKRRQPWVTDFEAMALKTVLHSLCKSLPLDPAGVLSQEVDSGYETGKQPNILADAGMVIDPADDKPMIEAAETHEEFVQKRQEIIDAKTAKPGKKPVMPAMTDVPRDLWAELVARYGEEECIRVLGVKCGFENWPQVPEQDREQVSKSIREELG